MNQKLSTITGLISLGLLITLIYKLTSVPGGMFLSGLCLGGVIIVIYLLGGLFLTWAAKMILKKLPFWTLYFTLTAIAFAAFHYQLYSPTLRIIIPENYVGEVNMIKSNLSDNILKLDTNGIGYLTNWTFKHSYTKPIIVDTKGRDLTELCVGFSESHFWGISTIPILGSKIKIKTKSFKVISKDKTEESQFYDTNLSELVDREKIK